MQPSSKDEFGFSHSPPTSINKQMRSRAIEYSTVSSEYQVSINRDQQRLTSISATNYINYICFKLVVVFTTQCTSLYLFQIYWTDCDSNFSSVLLNHNLTQPNLHISMCLSSRLFNRIMPGSHYWVRIGQGRAVWRVYFVPCPVPIVRIGPIRAWNRKKKSSWDLQLTFSPVQRIFMTAERIVPDLHYWVRIGLGRAIRHKFCPLSCPDSENRCWIEITNDWCVYWLFITSWIYANLFLTDAITSR